jgi:hypothetical protein
VIIPVKKILLILSTLWLFGCQSNIASLDAVWEKENSEIFKSIGVREYTGLTKEQAVNAMVIAFQRLDLIVDSSDFRTGLLSGSATAPKPLTQEEFEIVKSVEDARARQHVMLLVWSLTGFESKFNVIFLDIPNGVQVSLRARLNYKAYRNDRIPISNFPPKATEIAIKKVWNEFEKVEFIQRATLKKK